MKRQKISLKKIAENSGVSISAVSRILNNSESFLPETRARVIGTARTLGYAPKHRTVGLVIPLKNPLGSYYVHLLQALMLVLEARNLKAEIVSENDLKLLNSRMICGAIVLSVNPVVERKWSEDSPLPLVQINGNISGFGNVVSVAMDGRSGARLSIERLRHAGHRKIAFLSDRTEEEESLVFSGRHDGYLEEMRAGGIAEPEKFCAFRTEDGGMAGIQKILKEGCTAGICVGAAYGIVVLHELKRLGRRIPEDFSLIGWEHPAVSEYLDPPLTCCQIEFAQLAECAVEQLKFILDGKRTGQRHWIPFSIIERKSVAPPPGTVKINLSEQIKDELKSGALSVRELAKRLGKNPSNGHFRRTLTKLRDRGIVCLTNPFAPRSGQQKILLTEKGLRNTLE